MLFTFVRWNYFPQLVLLRLGPFSAVSITWVLEFLLNWLESVFVNLSAEELISIQGKWVILLLELFHKVIFFRRLIVIGLCSALNKLPVPWNVSEVAMAFFRFFFRKIFSSAFSLWKIFSLSSCWIDYIYLWLNYLQRSCENSFQSFLAKNGLLSENLKCFLSSKTFSINGWSDWFRSLSIQPLEAYFVYGVAQRHWVEWSDSCRCDRIFFESEFVLMFFLCDNWIDKCLRSASSTVYQPLWSQFFKLFL